MADYIIYNGQLYHHGIQGMKWGIRRYQNEDGSLTDAGKKRYAKFEKKIEKQQRKIEKLGKKLDGQLSRNAVKAAKYRIKEAKYTKRMYKNANPLIRTEISDAVYRNNMRKRDKFAAKALKLESKINITKSKIDKAQALINKYNRKLDKLDPNRINKGSQYVSSYSNKKLSTLHSDGKNLEYLASKSNNMKNTKKTMDHYEKMKKKIS